MTLFVVVQRRIALGHEYIADDTSPEGYAEYSAARADADAAQKELGDGWRVYVGRVVEVEE